MRKYNSMADLIDNISHEPDDRDLNDEQLFTEAAEADRPLDFGRGAQSSEQPANSPIRWQARRWN